MAINPDGDVSGHHINRAVEEATNVGWAVNVLTRLAGGFRPAADPHTRIHAGDMFRIDSLLALVDPADDAVTLANNANLDIVISASADSYPHISEALYRLGGAGRILIYELADGDAVSGGTAITPSNYKWDSEKVFLGSVLVSPTVSLVGATLKAGCAILGTELGQQRTGGGGGFDDEIIITPEKPYLIRLRNKSGGTVTACLCIAVYNAGKIPT